MGHNVQYVTKGRGWKLNQKNDRQELCKESGRPVVGR